MVSMLLHLPKALPLGSMLRPEENLAVKTLVPARTLGVWSSALGAIQVPPLTACLSSPHPQGTKAAGQTEPNPSVEQPASHPSVLIPPWSHGTIFSLESPPYLDAAATTSYLNGSGLHSVLQSTGPGRGNGPQNRPD